MKPLILATLFALAAGPALAEPLEFSSAPGPALRIARTLMGTERGITLPDDEKLSIALVDLDGDGTRDIFAFAEDPYFCGTAGCLPRLYVLDRAVGKWHDVPMNSEATFNGAPENWSTGSRTARGWIDLEFTTPDVRLEFTYNGTEYIH